MVAARQHTGGHAVNALRPSPSVQQITTEDGTVLLDIDSGRFYGLNPIGSAIWEALVKGHGIEQITRDIAEHYEASPTRIRGDVDMLVAKLRDRNLLHTTAG
jgi:hypothetical protein